MNKKRCLSLSLMTAIAALFVSMSPAMANTTDERIEASAKESYVFKTYLKNDDIVVHSHDGVVSLSGVVEEDFHKSLAEETVAGLPGVKSVNSTLTLKNPAPTASSDAWIQNKVRVALLFHRSVSAVGTDVTVNKGVVTLKGNADSQSQKELTAEYASDVEGVKRVVNDMVVVTKAPGKKSMGEIIE